MPSVSRCTATAFLVLGLVGGGVTQAGAADPSALRGLNTFHILIEELSTNEIACGITEQSLETSMRFILGQSRMQIVARRPGLPYIYVNINSLSAPLCAMSYRVSVNASAMVLETGVTAFGAMIWDAGGVRSGPGAAASITASIESIAKTLVNDWNAVNK